MNTEFSIDEFPAANRDEWFKAAAAVLMGQSVDEKLSTMTPEGLMLKPLYDQTDLDSLGAQGNWPGISPFTRGSKAAGNKIDRWWVAQDMPAGNPESFNELLCEELMQGRTAVTLPLDAVTADMKGGRLGLSIGSLRDLQKVLKGIDLQAAPMLAWAGPSSLTLIGMIEALLAGGQWRGAVLSDPLGESLVSELMVGIDNCYEEMAVVAKWASANQKEVRTIGVQGHHWGDAGATAMEELAYTLATATEYLKAMVERGLTATELGGQFVFSLSLGTDLFMQVAKIRAARLLWSKILVCCGGDPAAVFIHARSSRFNKSLIDPHSNILRSTAEGFAGVIGGANSLHLSPWDEVAGGDDPGARRLARNTQLILSEECGFADVADAAGGAWYVEALTDQLARKAWAEFQKIEQMGGIRKILADGLPQQAVAKSAGNTLARMSQRRIRMVGVNLSPDLTERFHRRETPEEAVETGNGLNPAPAASGLLSGVEEVAQAFRRGESLMAVRGQLGRGGKTGQVISKLQFPRAAEGYERLRSRLCLHEKTTGVRQIVWLAKFGSPALWTARAEFVRGFFSIAGFELQEDAEGAPSMEDALLAAKRASAHIVVLCATDDDYEKIVPEFVSALKKQVPAARVVLAGNPAGRIDEYQRAGIDDFVHVRTDCLAYLQQLTEQLGISGS